MRRTQEERSAETRGRLKEATIEALATLGYRGASTTVICRLAGVSRGAQLHHYPTKAELMAAAVDHLFERRHGLLRDALEAAPPGKDRVGLGLDMLWSIFSTDAHAAWMELVVAGRTDPELAAQLLRVENKMVEAGRLTCARLLDGDPDDPRIAAVTRMVLALFEGLALNQALGGPDSDRTEALTAFARLVRASAQGRDRDPPPAAARTGPA